MHQIRNENSYHKTRFILFNCKNLVETVDVDRRTEKLSFF